MYRNGNDVGRPVAAKGLWCDILSSPYHCFGILCEDKAYYEKTNKEFKYTAVDIAERNVLSLMHELDSGSQNEPNAGKLHRAAAARGPTDAEVRLLSLNKCLACVKL